MSQFLSPVCNDQIIDADGNPLIGGQVETYLAGSTTPAATYTSSSGATQNPNPIILNALGFPPSPIWLTGGLAYKFIIKDADGATLRTIDNISGVNDAAVSQSQWVESGLTPTYIDATSFSVPGDQTTELQVGRRLKTQNTSGFIYSTIDAAVFGAGVTTITTVNDSGTLDAGLSTVAYGLISADDTSFPFVALGAANTINLTDDGTTNASHYLTFAGGTAGQEALKTDTAKLAYNPYTGDLSGQAQVGDVKYTARSSAPSGWLKANGAAVSRSTYAALFAVVGTTYGVGDGATTFNLPDLRGEFLRGWDDARGVDSGRALGSAQADAFKAHNHGTHKYSGSLTGSTEYSSNLKYMDANVPEDTVGGAETRPRNIALLAVIKF